MTDLREVFEDEEEKEHTSGDEERAGEECGDESDVVKPKKRKKDKLEGGPQKRGRNEIHQVDPSFFSGL